MVEVFTAADGARIAYRDEGAGMPVLCLAGLTRDGRDFDDLAPHLPPCRLVRMDYRGRGASAHTGAATYTVAQEATDALSLLDHLGIARAAVIGTSRGGIIGMFLAATARARLAGLCLVDVGPVLEAEGLGRIAAYVGRPPAARTLAEAAGMIAAGSVGFEGVAPERWLHEAARRFVPRDGGLGLCYDPALAEAFHAALSQPQPDLWPLFGALAGLPVALVRGTGSDLLSEATAAEMARRHPGLIRAEVPGRGHVPFLDEPESVAAIRAWLAEVAAGGAGRTDAGR
jgi:pimeloyl-ACP methyl ester carboxylesterase